MLTNIISQTSPGAGSLYIRASSSNILAPVGTSILLNGRNHQQARSYRCGIWSTLLDPEFQRHSRRRHRMIKYKYAESLNRRSSWDQSLGPDDAKITLRRAIGKYWQAGASFCGSRMVSYDARPSRPNEGNQKTTSSSSTWTSPLGNVINRWTKQSSPGVKRASSYHGSSTAEEEYIIDPITNRKVIRKTYGAAESKTEVPTETFKSYRSQFSPFAPPSSHGQNDFSPVYSDGPPPREELDKYKEVEIDPLPAAPYHTVQSEEYSLNHLPPEDQAEVYDDLHNYQPSEHDEIKDSAAEMAPKYDDLHNYKPKEHDEIRTPSVEPAQAYDDLHKYKPTDHDEIKYNSEQPVQKYQDLQNYRPTEHDEIASPASRSAPKYDDLGDYKPFRYKESDATQPEPESVYDDLHKYRPYMHNEDAPSDLATAPKYEDLDKYKSHTDHIDSGVDSKKPQYEDLDKYQPFLHQEGQSEKKQGPQYEDLDKYRSDVFKELQPAEEGEPFEQYGDLEQYKSAYRYQEPDGKAPLAQDRVGEGLGEFDVKKENRENLEQAMTSYIAVSDAVDREVSASLQRSRQREMEDESSVNIFRDSPEKFFELLKEHGIGPVQDDPVPDEARQVNIQSAEKEYSDNLTHDFNSNMEPALGRAKSPSKNPISRHQQTEADTGPCSKGSQGLETSNEDEQDVKEYGDSNPENPVTIPQTPGVEPTIYKILAYDPTMQNVSVAETTSIVPDQAAPLTPSEVLLRLANPTKFLPHFEPLRAEGFEIVSGRGDVLVFRKVREPTTTTSTPETNNTNNDDTAAAAPAPPVNPIDMMGRSYSLPNAAAFASPTGFVNYNDSSFVEEPPRPPPFRSQIDVRREEPVFSGPKNYADKSKKKKKKTSVTKKMLVGGVWVAGISYALGVIGEYFATGGIDGKGPTGF